MIQVKCPNCGAPLEVENPSASVKCGFCGGSFVAGRGGQGTSTTGRAGRRGPAALIVALAIVLLFGAGLAVYVLAMQRPSPVVAQRPIAASDLMAEVMSKLPQQPPRKGVSPSELSLMTQAAAWFDVDVPNPPWDWTRVDPVACISFLLDLAKKWSTDAQIDLAFVRGVTPDGLIDVSARKDRKIDIRFYSPTLRASAREMRKVSEKEIESEFRLEIKERRIRAMIGTEFGGRRDKKESAPYVPACPGAKLFETWTAKGLEPRPAYDLALQFVSNSQRSYWRWTINSATRDRIKAPSLSPTDCSLVR